jgi:hypothetical protein
MTPSRAATPAGAPWGPLIFRTFMICVTIGVLGAAALYVFFERFGRVEAELRSRQALAALPQAIRPPRATQLLVQVSNDGLTLQTVPIDLGPGASPRSEQMTRIIDEVLRSAAVTISPVSDVQPFTRRAVFEVNGIIVVDLAREPSVPPLDFRSECLLAYGLVNSLADNFDDILAVRILIDGEPAQTLSGALDISTPLVPNAALRGTL